ncbi:MAG: NAD-dependent malic enzyme 1 [Anaerolinea sp. 4484_236]|nr:MAG: NAD-dependent malic enzyme 1 [Anaerolinea sp. 4484_236]
MAWERSSMRTVRVRNKQIVGTLANLLAAISASKGSVGEVKLLNDTMHIVERDITVYAADETQMAHVIEAIRNNPGTEIDEIRDQVLEMHQKGKIAIRSRYDIDTLAKLRRVYTPGVANVCHKIAENPDLARHYTITSHLVAIVTDGTAVLGLGDIGALAGMPVMEGKAMLMESLVGLSGIPILLDTKDTDEIVETIANIAPTFAAIQLEDISAPRCFEIEKRLQDRLDIPVMHDDQHGTAAVTTAALMVATRRAGTDLGKAVIAQIGLGAAGFATVKMLMKLTGNPVMGADLDPAALQRLEEAGGQPATLEEIMAKADIVVATTGVQGLIKAEMVRKGQIILALSNPYPEIEPEVALKAGAAFAADGKSVNNVLGFPGIFRGAVDANASDISEEMLLAAAQTLADLTKEGYLVPHPLNKKVHQAVARAVAEKAFEQGLARAEYVPYVD